MTTAELPSAGSPSKTLDELTRDCADETALFFRGHNHDSPDCFELFRRALELNSQRAWESICAQYLPLVRSWVAQHPELAHSGGDIHDLANRAFERMWAAWTPDKFRRFRDLRALLAYLKMCAHSAVIEELRRAGPSPRPVVLSDLPEDALDVLPRNPGPSVESEVLHRERREELWQMVRARLRDDRERLVLHDLFLLDLKPAALLARHREVFRDIREVYLIRQVVLERLGRDAQLRKFFGLDA